MGGGGERDNAIISIADIAISACALPRRGGGSTMLRVSVIFHGHRVSTQKVSPLRLKSREEKFGICECKY